MNYALVFPGQGSQYIGMCQELIETSPTAANVFERANEALGEDLSSLINEGQMAQLTLSQYAQPAIVTASYALFRVFVEKAGELPTCAVGHSLGELSAFIAAGAISFEEGIVFARNRGEIMHRVLEQKLGHAALVLDIDVNQLEEIVTEIKSTAYVAISGYNSPRQFIIAGSIEGIQLVEQRLARSCGECIPFRMMPMKADAPYHSSLMEYVVTDCQELLQKMVFKPLQFDVWSTVTRQKVKSSEELLPILCEQLVTPVYWSQTLSQIVATDVELFIDIGPQQIMRNLMREDTSIPKSLAYDGEDKQSITNLLF